MSLSSENPDTTEFTSGYDNITSDAQTGSDGLRGETILYIVIGCIVLLGNGFVIVSIYKTPFLRKKLVPHQSESFMLQFFSLPNL